jgi:hypothetical protein
VVRCNYPNCSNEATYRCHTCKQVYCVAHNTVRGGGGYTGHYSGRIDPVTNECDVCTENRRRMEVAAERDHVA